MLPIVQMHQNSQLSGKKWQAVPLIFFLLTRDLQI